MKKIIIILSVILAGCTDMKIPNFFGKNREHTKQEFPVVDATDEFNGYDKDECAESRKVYDSSSYKKLLLIYKTSKYYVMKEALRTTPSDSSVIKVIVDTGWKNAKKFERAVKIVHIVKNINEIDSHTKEFILSDENIKQFTKKEYDEWMKVNPKTIIVD